MTQTLANRMTTAPDQVFVACNPLQAREEELATSDLYELQGGGAWIEVVKWVIVTLASFEAGTQYGQTRDAIEDLFTPDPIEEPEITSLSFHTAEPDNTRVGG